MRGLIATVAAMLIAGLACSSNDSKTGTGGSGGSGATGGSGGATTNASCQDIRMCAKDCADDACLNTCKSRGTAAAQANFQALYDCTADSARGNCTMANVISDCVCMAQCYDGACLAEVDACTAGATDVVCEGNCH
jgi:hypothetical protein